MTALEYLTDGIPEQLLLMLYSTAVGAFCGVLWDVFRAVRIISIPPKSRFVSTRLYAGVRLVFIALCDIFAMTAMAVTVELFVFRASSGMIFEYMLVPLCIGFAAYKLTASKLILLFTRAVNALVRRLVGAVFTLIITPLLRLLSKAGYRIYKATVWRLLKAVYRRYGRMQTEREARRLCRLMPRLLKNERKVNETEPSAIAGQDRAARRVPVHDRLSCDSEA